MYFELEKKNIIGKERIKIINSVYDFHINTLYRWIYIYYNYDEYNTNFTYNNIKITYDIEQFIIKSIDGNNNFNIKKIKKILKPNLIFH